MNLLANFSVQKATRRYFAGKLRWAIFWFGLIFLLIWLQIELFYGPWAGFYDAHPYALGLICGVDFAAFCISLGNLLTRLVTRFNYTKRLRRDVQRYVSGREADDPYALLDADVCYAPAAAPIYLGDKWLVTPGHAMLRERLVGVFYEDLSKSFLSKKIRLTVVDDAGESFYLDTSPKLHPELFRSLALLHPGATNADHSVLRGFWQREVVDYRLLRLGDEKPRRVSDI